MRKCANVPQALGVGGHGLVTILLLIVRGDSLRPVDVFLMLDPSFPVACGIRYTLTNNTS